MLLIGWDAADWKIINPLIERGEMLVLARFLEQGVMGDITTLEPILSPMLWNSIATGKRADKHGILGFTEVDPHSGGVRPITSTSRKAKALWNILSQRGYRSTVVNWFGGHPAEPINGVIVSDAYVRPLPGVGEPWPMMKRSVHPERLTAKLKRLRVRPEQVKPETVLLFAPSARDVDQKKDRRLGVLIKLIAECLTTHAAATYLIENEPWDFTAIYYGAIDHFSHGFMRMHPPRQKHIGRKLFDIYHDVINSAYRLHDLMLGALLQLVDNETTVILLSDHGFHSDHLRPRRIPKIPTGPAIEHRPLGVFVMRGPGVKRDERIYGVNLLDIAPTVLSLFDLPVGRDMDGRVLVEAFEKPPKIDIVQSWETEPGETGMHTGAMEMEADEAKALLEQFVALGYIDDPAEDKEEAARNCRAEQDWNLARVYLDAERYLKALPLLEKIHEELPERFDIALTLARTLLRIGLLEEAEAAVLETIDTAREAPAGRALLGEIAFQQKNYGESLDHLLAAKKSEPRLPILHVQIGNTLLKLKSWADAEESFRRAIKIDIHNAPAHLGLAAALLRQRRNLEAAEAALSAVSYAHPLPLGHYYLGLALARMRQPERAALALETALRLNPAFPPAYRALARIYKRLGQVEKSKLHRDKLKAIATRRRQQREKITRIRREAAERSRERRVRLSKRAKIKAAETEIQKGEPSERLEFLIVSGLPRSGTSLMMQMLGRAGVPIMTDGKRLSDEDNPEGYFEWEEIKKIRRRPEILRKAKGKAIKVITALLPALPRKHRYKVIFMDRPISEVVASQAKMIARRGTKAPEENPERMAQMLAGHRGAVLQHLQRARNIRFLKINYGELVEAPEKFVKSIVDLAGAKNIPRPEAMASAVRPELHRNRVGAAM